MQLFTSSKPSLADMPLIDVLRLIRTQNVGTVTFYRLIERFGTAAKALEKLPELAARGGRKQPLVAYPKSLAEVEIDKVQLYGAKMTVYGAEDYPKLMMTMDDPPPVLTYVGNPLLWQTYRQIAMVGARNASANGC